MSVGSRELWNPGVDGKGKAAPSACGKWLVGLRDFGCAREARASRSPQIPNEFNDDCAIGGDLQRETGPRRAVSHPPGAGP